MAEAALYRLAGAAWNVRRIPASSDFILRPEQLSRPEAADDMAAIVGHLYAHARKWAPGLEIPYRVPHVSISPLVSTAGQYRSDSDGYLFIDLSSEFKAEPSAVLAILAHEACHHILDLSGIRGNTREESERLTDLATFICGFGELVLAGHSQVRRVGAIWTAIHLGYLSPDEYRFAQRWVLAAQRLQDAESPTLPEQRKGLWARLRSWFGGAAPDIIAPAPPSAPPLLDPTTHRRKVALARLAGDRALLERRIKHERRRQPSATELELLDAVIESLDRDRR
ncbi:MAG: hypothetical protein ACREM3_10005 [Candidatus Rokuibacteriota bacterium]